MILFNNKYVNWRSFRNTFNGFRLTTLASAKSVLNVTSKKRVKQFWTAQRRPFLFFKELNTKPFPRPSPFLYHGRFTGFVRATSSFKAQESYRYVFCKKKFTPQTLLKLLYFSDEFHTLRTRRVPMRFKKNIRSSLAHRRNSVLAGGRRRLAFLSVTRQRVNYIFSRFLYWGAWHRSGVKMLHAPGKDTPLQLHPRISKAKAIESDTSRKAPLVLLATRRLWTEQAAVGAFRSMSKLATFKGEGLFILYWGLRNRWKLRYGDSWGHPRLVARYDRTLTVRISAKRRPFFRNRLRKGLFLLHRFCKKFWGYRRTFVLKNAMRPIAKLYGYKATRFIHCFGFRFEAVANKVLKINRLKYTKILINWGLIRLNGHAWTHGAEICKKFDVISISRRAHFWVKALQLLHLRFKNNVRKINKLKGFQLYSVQKAGKARWRNTPIILGPQRKFAVLWNMRRLPAMSFFTKKTLNKLTPKVARILYRSTCGHW